MLTINGIHLAFSLPLQDERIPLTLQVLRVNVISPTSSAPERVEVTLSDGVYFSVMIFPQQLHTVGKQLSTGDVVTVIHYIAQHLHSDKVIIICLDVSVLGLSESQIGTPSEFTFIPDGAGAVTTNFIGDDIESYCKDCKATPCEWQLYGKTIYDAVLVYFTNCSPSDISTRNKSCRFSAYQMYTRAKHGYLGKGNRTPIPSCVVRYIRKNFPDTNDKYVGFIPKDD